MDFFNFLCLYHCNFFEARGEIILLVYYYYDWYFTFTDFVVKTIHELWNTITFFYFKTSLLKIPPPTSAILTHFYIWKSISDSPLTKLYFISWNYNRRSTISFSVSKIPFVYLMTPIDSINNQSTMRWVI